MSEWVYVMEVKLRASPGLGDEVWMTIRDGGDVGNETGQMNNLDFVSYRKMIEVCWKPLMHVKDIKAAQCRIILPQFDSRVDGLVDAVCKEAYVF